VTGGVGGGGEMGERERDAVGGRKKRMFPNWGGGDMGEEREEENMKQNDNVMVGETGDRWGGDGKGGGDGEGVGESGESEELGRVGG
jgi:hypothetical protein